MQDELDQLLAVRKGFSHSLCEWQARQRELPAAASALAPAIKVLQARCSKQGAPSKVLQAQIKELTRRIEELTKTPETQMAQELQKVSGIGPIVAATLVSRLTSRSFSHPDKFVAYCGLDVRVRQSGKKNGQLGLSKQGDPELRRLLYLLYLAAQASVKAKESPFQDQYQREQEKEFSKTAALCAVSRKIARLAWSMVTHQSTYDPDRIYKQDRAHKRI